MGLLKKFFGKKEADVSNRKYPTIQCTKCGSLYPDSVIRCGCGCDCGYEFPLIPEEQYVPSIRCCRNIKNFKIFENQFIIMVKNKY